jgi:hypothetical protein
MELNLPVSKVIKLYIEYWKLRRLDKLYTIYKETNGKLGPFLKLYRLIKEKGMSIEQVANAVEIAIHNLPHMETLYIQAKDQAEKTQHTVQRLSNDIAAKEYKISLLDKIAFSSEQECKRKYQEIQELADKKDRIEKLIANIVNGEGYSKLIQTIKENVKAALSERRVLISVSLAALIQTLKADPQTVKLIQNIPSTNNDEQHKDDNNNITKYLESNKDTLLDLAEKYYENLVEALTNDSISSAAASFSNRNPHSSIL